MFAYITSKDCKKLKK